MAIEAVLCQNYKKSTRVNERLVEKKSRDTQRISKEMDAI
uniref:Uncharacterized protein n=1 Tax=Romanomermis culicivorax TaxID=13658 RepID=A0A915K1U6_ROMCU